DVCSSDLGPPALSLDDSLRAKRPDVVEGVAELGQYVGRVLAEARWYATHLWSVIVPEDREPDALVVRDARVRRPNQHAARARLRSEERRVHREDRRAWDTGDPEALEEVGGLELARDRRQRRDELPAVP